MKKRFETSNQLMQYMERQSERYVKHYRTDWKHYDRPSMMACAASCEKEVYIILRDCGSYLYRAEEILDLKRDFPAAVMEYYEKDPSAKYYRVDFRKNSVETIPSGLPMELKAARMRAERSAYGASY